MNDFLPEDTPDTSPDETSSIHFGDLVTMTIVDVFESDETGKLLSYCPTFDNRSVKKTYHTTEQIRRQSSKMKGRLHEVSKSKAVAGANKGLRIVSLSYNISLLHYFIFLLEFEHNKGVFTCDQDCGEDENRTG